MSRTGITDEIDERTDAGLDAVATIPSAHAPRPGGSRELLMLALPLIVSQSFMTVQVFVDTILLSHHDPREMAASFPAVMWFWLPFGLLQVTAGYVSTFVAQYTGAGRPERVGPAVWQGIHFAILAGLSFLLLVPAAHWVIAVGGHTPKLQALEVVYLRCLCFAALPMLVMAAVNGFFSGRGQTWIVLGIEAAGTAVNVALALVMIFGRAGFPEMGIAGAGWATVVGSWTSALFALSLLLRPRYRKEFRTLSGWRPERELFGRLMKYGGPAGMQVFLDVLVFNVFVQLVGRLGEAATGATTLTIRLNMVAFLPMMGLGQAVSILVGQRLGADRPDLAERLGIHRSEVVIRVHVLRGGDVSLDSRGSGRSLQGRPRPGEFRGGGRDCSDLDGVRGRVFGGGFGELDVLVRPARRRRYPVRHLANLRARLADHGGADLPGGARRRQHLCGLGLRVGVHHRHGRLFLPAVPDGQVEADASDRGGSPCGMKIHR